MCAGEGVGVCKHVWLLNSSDEFLDKGQYIRMPPCCAISILANC